MNQQQPLLQGNFIHQVYFWLADPENHQNRKSLREGLKKLSSIPHLLHFHIGTPATTRRDVIDSSYTFSWLAIFRTAEDQDIYQEHPIHLEFVANCSHLWKKVVVYDSLDATIL
jgi:hypothetical protein